MLKYLVFPATVLIGLGVCLWVASPQAQPAQENAVRVTSVTLKGAVDRSSPCKLSLSATIEASGKGEVWFRFEGPAGVDFRL